MKPAFYADQQYRKEQSEKVKAAWKMGLFNSLIKPSVQRLCRNPKCDETFSVKPSSKKQLCSPSCSVSFSNTGRKHSEETKRKIAASVMKNPNCNIVLNRGVRKVPYISIICHNPACKKIFEQPPYKSHMKYCSVNCAMKVIGAQTTSPKAAKSKQGIRSDIDQNIIFYIRPAGSRKNRYFSSSSHVSFF